MTDTRANELIARVKQDMRQAMKDRNTAKLSALRPLSARISNAEAVQATSLANSGVGSTEVPRRQLTLSEVQQIVTVELYEIETALDAIDKSSAYAADLRKKATIIRQYLVA